MSHSRIAIYLVRFTSFRTYFYTCIKSVNNLHEFPTYFYLYILLYYANMKSYVFIVGVLLLIVTMTLNVTAHDDDSDIMIIDMPPQPTQRLLLEKRKSSDNKKKKNKKKYSKDCKKRTCPLVLKPCPKDCPMSCGYIDSPDPCCPLLGKPSCPDY